MTVMGGITCLQLPYHHKIMCESIQQLICVFRIWSRKETFQNIPAGYLSCSFFSDTVRRAKSSSQLSSQGPCLNAGHIFYQENFSRSIYNCRQRLPRLLGEETESTMYILRMCRFFLLGWVLYV